MVAKATDLGLSVGFHGDNCRCHAVGTTHYPQDTALTLASGFTGHEVDSCGNQRDMARFAALFVAANVTMLVESCGNGPAGTEPKEDLPPLPRAARDDVPVLLLPRLGRSWAAVLLLRLQSEPRPPVPRCDGAALKARVLGACSWSERPAPQRTREPTTARPALHECPLVAVAFRNVGRDLIPVNPRLRSDEHHVAVGDMAHHRKRGSSRGFAGVGRASRSPRGELLSLRRRGRGARESRDAVHDGDTAELAGVGEAHCEWGGRPPRRACVEGEDDRTPAVVCAPRAVPAALLIRGAPRHRRCP